MHREGLLSVARQIAVASHHQAHLTASLWMYVGLAASKAVIVGEDASTD